MQVVMAITLDGFLPKENEELMKWLRTGKDGFSYWRKEAAFTLLPHYPLLDLMHAKRKYDDSYVHLAEINDADSAHFLHGLFLYNMVDEIVLYQLPISYGNGFSLTDSFRSCRWNLHKVKAYPNNICRIIYRRIPLL